MMALKKERTAIWRLAESCGSSKLRVKSAISVCDIISGARTIIQRACVKALRESRTHSLSNLKADALHGESLKVVHGRQHFLVPARHQTQSTHNLQYLAKKSQKSYVGEVFFDSPRILVRARVVLRLWAMMVMAVG